MDTLSAVCEGVASDNSRLHKLRLVSDYLRSLDAADQARAVEILSGRPVVKLPVNQELFEERHRAPITLSIGGASLANACIAATGLDRDTVWSCWRETGDAGEAISRLIAPHTRNQPLSLTRAEEIYTAVYGARRMGEKVEILRMVFSTYRPLAVKYFVKAISGDLRIGLQEKMVAEAVAQVSGIAVQSIQLFHPVDFMLAKPIETPEDLDDAAQYIIEDKYDGIRSQAHILDGRVRIYSRGMREVTAAFPEIVFSLSRIRGSVILDGEILAWRDGKALSFGLLQHRLARKRVSEELQDRAPVVFMAYDILFCGDKELAGEPIEARRAILEDTHAGAFLLSPQFQASSTEELERLFDAARARGNEGLVLKRRGSFYEPAKRSGSWYKLKRPLGTLDVVITAVEQGHGKRARMLSDYTFAVRGKDGYLNVGKAYTGLTDAEIRELTEILRGLAVGRSGRVLHVRPEIVLEVAFGGIQKSSRHNSGYALRFPRILRWRHDKKPEDSDTIERVQELYEASLR